MRAAVLFTTALLLGAQLQGAAAGTWETLPDLPIELGEVSAGLLVGEDNVTYVVVLGEGDPGTYIYNTNTQEWTSGAPRGSEGNHIGAQVINNELYLFGGLRGGGDEVQIYNLEDDEWRAGATLPYEAGSAGTGYIGGKVYFCGGIVEDDTVDTCLAYDVEANAWEEGVASMPYGVNHAASATHNDLMYVAGGRMGRNRVGEGFDFLQIYDPATNEWELGPPLPAGRGGMGKAVVHDGAMYVFGGESDVNGPNDETGLTSSNVYERVDVLNLTTLEWSLDTPMLVPRHGIFPVQSPEGDIVYLPGGGVSRGNSQSTAFTAFRV